MFHCEQDLLANLIVLSPKNARKEFRNHIQEKLGYDDTQIISIENKIIEYKNEGAMACKISGWKGLLGNKESDKEHPRLGKELSEYAKKSGLKGIMHSDELPNYGIEKNCNESCKQ